MGRHEVLPKWAQLGKEPPRYRRESAPVLAPAALSDQERAFEMTTVGGMPVYEVAAALDVSPADVRAMVRKQAACVNDLRAEDRHNDAAFLRRWLVAEEGDE